MASAKIAERSEQGPADVVLLTAAGPLKQKANGGWMMTALDGIFEHHWAIDPAWLPRLAALAQRHGSAPVVGDQQPWQKRDYGVVAGKSAPKLAGAMKASLVDGVAVLPIFGPIFPRANLMTEMSGATSLNILSSDLKVAVASPDVHGILLMIDSPGGAVSGVAAFVDLVRHAAQRKPLKAYIGGNGASAAYWIASAATEISVDRSAIIGSIGVVLAAAKQVAPDSEGYLSIEVVSTNAPAKRPDPTVDEGVAELRSTLDAIERLFIADVARGRKVSEAKVRAEFGKGGVKVGAEAKAAGMIDRVATLDWALNDLRPSRDALNRQRLAALR